MKQIQLTQGKVAIIDDDDFALVSKRNWYAMKSGRTFYAVRNVPKAEGGQTLVCMHRLITGASPGEQVDHIDGDGLNNQVSNLRICTTAENARNSKKHRVASSKFKGVSMQTQTQKWIAQYRVGGKNKYIGCFENEEDAARAYDDAASIAFGEFAKTNKMLWLLE